MSKTARQTSKRKVESLEERANMELLAFERAENEPNRAEHDRLLTIVVLGRGATGLELAGAFVELIRQVLRRDFHHIDPGELRFAVECRNRHENVQEFLLTPPQAILQPLLHDGSCPHQPSHWR